MLCNFITNDSNTAGRVLQTDVFALWKSYRRCKIRRIGWILVTKYAAYVLTNKDSFEKTVMLKPITNEKIEVEATRSASNNAKKELRKWRRPGEGWWREFCKIQENHPDIHRTNRNPRKPNFFWHAQNSEMTECWNCLNFDFHLRVSYFSYDTIMLQYIALDILHVHYNLRFLVASD